MSVFLFSVLDICFASKTKKNGEKKPFQKRNKMNKNNQTNDSNQIYHYFHCRSSLVFFFLSMHARWVSGSRNSWISGLFYSQRTTEMSFFCSPPRKKHPCASNGRVDSFVFVQCSWRVAIFHFLILKKKLRWMLLLNVIYWFFTDDKPRDIIFYSLFILFFSSFQRNIFNELVASISTSGGFCVRAKE